MIADRPVIWKAMPGSQTFALASNAQFQMMEGSRGGGKTDTLLMDYIATGVGRGYGSDYSGIILRRTCPELRDVEKKSEKWFALAFPGARYNRTEKTWTFPGGEKLRLGFCSVESDYMKHHGYNYQWIGYEELVTWPDSSVFEKMNTTLRTSVEGVVPRVFMTCNPFGPGHGWVKTWMIDDKISGKMYKGGPKPLLPGTYCRISSYVYENLALLKADEDYLRRLANISDPLMRRAWAMGDWDIASGGMFDDLMNSLYEPYLMPDVDINRIPLGYRFTRSYDHGTSSPFAVLWWAQSNGEPLPLKGGDTIPCPASSLVLIGEIYGGEKGNDKMGLRMPTERIATWIRDYEDAKFPGRRIYPGPADSAIFPEDIDHPDSGIIEIFRASGIHWTKSIKGAGSRIAGWTRMRDMMEAAKNGDESWPQLLVAKGAAPAYWRTVSRLRRDEKSLDDVGSNPKQADHAGDAARYMVMTIAYRKNDPFSQIETTYDPSIVYA